MKIEDFFIYDHMSVQDAANVINNNTKKTAFLVDDGVLRGSISDGDLRRFLIKNGDVTSSVKDIVNYSPVYLHLGNTEDIQNFMIMRALDALPIVDDDKRIVKLEFLDSSISIEDDLIPNGTDVVIMAGGKGSRLKPYSDIIPKPLFPVGDKTVIEHIMDRFVRQGGNKFSVVVNYKKALIKTYFAELDSSYDISFIEEDKYRGTAGGIQLIESITDDFFVTNCDILVRADYAEILESHKKQNNVITIVAASKDVVVPYGTLIISKDHKVKKIMEKPKINNSIVTGMYVCNKRVRDYISGKEVVDMPDLISACLDNGDNVGAYVIEENAWLDMGELQELDKMKKHIDNFDR